MVHYLIFCRDLVHPLPNSFNGTLLMWSCDHPPSSQPLNRGQWCLSRKYSRQEYSNMQRIFQQLELTVLQSSHVEPCTRTRKIKLQAKSSIQFSVLRMVLTVLSLMCTASHGQNFEALRDSCSHWKRPEPSQILCTSCALQEHFYAHSTLKSTGQRRTKCMWWHAVWRLYFLTLQLGERGQAD